MTQELYDVIVVGAAEATPAGEARLSATLARAHGLPAATVVRSLAEKNLRMGERLPREAAEALLQQLKASGALTSVRRASAAPVQTPIPTPLHGFAATGSPAAATLQGLGALNLPLPGGRPPAAPTLAPLGAVAAAPRTGNTGTFRAPAPTGNTGNFRAAAPGTNPGSGPKSGPPTGPKSGGGLRPLTSGGGAAPALALAEPAPSTGNAFAPPATADPFTVPDGGEDSPLELALPVSTSTSSVMERVRGFQRHHTLPGASALNTSKITATSSSSGLDVDDEAGETNSERCPTHGLVFDRRKSSACRKCFEEKRSAARGPARSAQKRRSDGRNMSPAKRAFMGLALALFLGFVPAAYYALFPGAGEVDRLRGEQQVLSEKAGTEENIRRFDQLEDMVASGHWKAIRNTLIIWVAISGVAMAGWYKTTS
jgi:hypothetical protein